MIIRLWSSTNQLAGLPFSTSVASWWYYCLDCDKLSGPIPGTIGPRGPVADSDDGVPQEVVDNAPSHVCKPKTAAAPAPAAEPVVLVAPRGGWTRHRWTPEQDRIVIGRSCKDAQEALGVSRSAVEWRRKQLRAEGRMRPARVCEPFTDEHDALILALPGSEAARLLGRNQSSISTRKAALLARAS